MSVPPVMPQTGSLLALMDELETLERSVHPDLSFYRWQQVTMELPAITNWLDDSPLGQLDQRRWRDQVVILARIIVGVNDDDMDRLALYADAFRAAVDPELHSKQPLNGVPFRAARQSMRQVPVQLGESIAGVGFEFPMVFDLDRNIEPR